MQSRSREVNGVPDKVQKELVELTEYFAYEEKKYIMIETIPNDDLIVSVNRLLTLLQEYSQSLQAHVVACLRQIPQPLMRRQQMKWQQLRDELHLESVLKQAYYLFETLSLSPDEENLINCFTEYKRIGGGSFWASGGKAINIQEASEGVFKSLTRKQFAIRKRIYIQ